MSHFLFILLCVMGVYAVVMLYNEIAQETSHEPPFEDSVTHLILRSGNDNLQELRSEHQAQQQTDRVGLEQQEVEKWRQPYYGSPDNEDVVDPDISMQRDVEENWVEYKSEVKDPVNEVYYFLLKPGGSNRNTKRPKKVKSEIVSGIVSNQNTNYEYKPEFDTGTSVWKLEDAHIKFDKEKTHQLSNQDMLAFRPAKKDTNHAGYQGIKNVKPDNRVNYPAGKTYSDHRSVGHVVSAQRVIPSVPHSLYRQERGGARYLVYVCDAYTLCGGWGDRQRGMVSTYFLSRLVGRQLKIVMPTPCDLANFYIPNKVPWIVSPSHLDSFTKVTVNAIIKKKFTNLLLDRNFNEMFPQQVVYLRTNQDYYKTLYKNPHYHETIRRWSGLGDKKSRFQWAWQDLMRPSPRLLARLERVLGLEFLVRKRRLTPHGSYRTHSVNDVGNSSLICAHVRFGKNPSFPNDTNRTRYTLDDLPLLFDFMLSKDLTGTARFYTASDYQLVKDKAKEVFSNKILNFDVTVMHIDRERLNTTACDGFESALLDQQILSLCDVLVVSRSGFSIYASYMAHTNQEVFIMENGNIKKFL
ncbi:hypothetical protein PoB_000417200 [Plakobranchus ocellatus]|uniref:Peptide-O-fucosyltransferase n=1 Tax=Plakobranchus ocellatus TaxID=259542 RepID=A0AAV3Y5E7_9GAST|nr:hypothetical protein PoB_000417200 [Plakobranchus ocellatus]